MYTRDAHNNEEVWLLDQIEEFNLDGESFRSRDYVIALDDTTDDRAAFGRVRVHDVNGDEFCELTSLTVLPEWEQSLAGNRVVDALLTKAAERGFGTVYAFERPDKDEPLNRAGLRGVEPDSLPSKLDDRRAAKADELEIPTDDLQPYKIEFNPEEYAEDAEDDEEEEITEEEIEQLAEEMGIDRDNQTYKYST